MKLRCTVVLLSTCFFLGLIVTAFWYQDWQYSLPTTRPAGLDQPAIGERLSLHGLPKSDGRPVFLHFFNPDCPCSRFNVDHVRELIRKHGSNVRFIAVLQGDGNSKLLQASFEKLDWGIERVVDESGAIGRAAGVYATPQAVLIDGGNKLYYRGNYNLSRYCADPATEFARIALESMLAGKAARPMDPAEETSYGCPLPRSRRAMGRKT